MNTENNVISLEHSVVSRVESAIIDALSNRGGNWVGQHVVTNAAGRVSAPNINIMKLIDQMVRDGLLEISFDAVRDKFGETYQLSSYRLAPKPW